MRFSRKRYFDLIFGRDTSRKMFVELFGPLIGLEEEWVLQGATPDEIELVAFDWDYVPFIDCGANSFIYDNIAQPVIIEETSDYILGIDRLGRRTKLCKGSSTLPLAMDWPVKDFQSWNKIKHVFTYRPERVNVKKIEYAANLQKNQDFVITANIFGPFDLIRMLMGDENACLAYYTQPELVHDIISTVKDMTLRVYEQVLENITIDQLMVHEDMAGKSGPMVGPKQIAEFYKSYYQSTWELFKTHGTKIFQMDSDGNMDPVLDILMECGLNSLYPFEPAAGMDIVKTRKKYGDKLIILGGIDKHVLRGTKKDIREELEYKMQPEMQKGGVIFGLDHRIPNGTPLENYRYYVDLGREILGIPPRNGGYGWQRMAFCGASIV